LQKSQQAKAPRQIKMDGQQDDRKEGRIQYSEITKQKQYD
jgi:hypothetical protein